MLSNSYRYEPRSHGIMLWLLENGLGRQVYIVHDHYVFCVGSIVLGVSRLTERTNVLTIEYIIS